MGQLKITIIGRPSREGSDLKIPIFLGVGPSARSIGLSLGIGPEIEMKQLEVPVQTDAPYYWMYRNILVKVESPNATNQDELLLRIKHKVLRYEKELTKIGREVEAFQNMERLPSARRERIPEDVRLFVWQRDEGRCIKCGNKERLEFDHIIPVVEGGSNTARNIQLLCETCNRQKGKTI